MKILDVCVTTDNFDNPMPHNRGFMYPSGQNDLFYKYDHVGNVIATLDYYGNLVNSIDMEAFGTVRSGGQTGIRLTTKEYHPEAELYYFNQRWYDKDNGRWVEAELKKADGPNLYHFNRANPLGNYDFDGNSAHAVPVNPTKNPSECLKDACGNQNISMGFCENVCRCLHPNTSFVQPPCLSIIDALYTLADTVRGKTVVPDPYDTCISVCEKRNEYYKQRETSWCSEINKLK